jgi:hypothetical protein
MTNYFEKYRYFKGNILDKHSELFHNSRALLLKNTYDQPHTKTVN